MGFRPPQSLEEWTSYQWGDESKLPWLAKTHGTYLKEAQMISAHSSYQNAINKNIVSIAYKNYCRLRLVGLIHGVRLFDIDNRIIRKFKPALAN